MIQKLFDRRIYVMMQEKDERRMGRTRREGNRWRVGGRGGAVGVEPALRVFSWSQMQALPLYIDINEQR